MGYCVGNIGQPIEQQIVGALNHLEERLKLVDLTFANVVQMDVLFKDVFDIPVMEKLLKKPSMGNFRLENQFRQLSLILEEVGILFQIDAIAFKEDQGK